MLKQLIPLLSPKYEALHDYLHIRTNHYLNNKLSSFKQKDKIFKDRPSVSCYVTKCKQNIMWNRDNSLTFYKKMYEYNPHFNNQRFLHQSINNRYQENDKGRSNEKVLPQIFYYQNPLSWLRNKFNFRKLRKVWDPNFNEAEFTRGSKQALSIITKIISNDEFDSLDGLLTKKAVIAVRKEVVLLWKDEVKRHIALDVQDIQLAVPTRIHFNKLEEDKKKKVCDIDMWFMALKWVEGGALIIIDIATRFNRDYTEGTLSDWTISIFQVRRFHVRYPGQDPEN